MPTDPKAVQTAHKMLAYIYSNCPDARDEAQRHTGQSLSWVLRQLSETVGIAREDARMVLEELGFEEESAEERAREFENNNSDHPEWAQEAREYAGAVRQIATAIRMQIP